MTERAVSSVNNKVSAIENAVQTATADTASMQGKLNAVLNEYKLKINKINELKAKLNAELDKVLRKHNSGENCGNGNLQ